MRRMLCVSIHDVAPATWRRCEMLLDAVARVAPVPLTLLVVPDYHGLGSDTPGWYRDALDARLALGDELTLHGYTHVDEAAAPSGPRAWLQRRVYTAGEGEFAALDETEARRRLLAGQAWFERHGWPLHGFVAPAWLLGEGGWRALAALRAFEYTTTRDVFHLLSPRLSIAAPCIVYSPRSAPRRAVSHLWNGSRAQRMRSRIVRLALHPEDARHPSLVTQAQRILERLLADGYRPLTKAACAATLRTALGVHGLSYMGGIAASDNEATPAPTAMPAITSLG